MKKLRILIAEAESQIRMELKTMLSVLGHEGLPATDGREALSILSAQAPDLAVLGIQMAFTDWREVAEMINRHRPIPILILTEFKELDLIEKTASLPAYGCLIKPVDKRNLAEAIETAISRFDESQFLAKETAELRYDLESRKLVDRAKGMLMKDGKTENQAYQEIQTRARSERISLRLAANELLQRSAH